MAYPSVERLELPVLQELIATGGFEEVRFLYDRLVAYFPQLDEREVRALSNGYKQQWRKLVQRAGRSLSERGEIERVQGRWTVTERGRERAASEETKFTPGEARDVSYEGVAGASHLDAQTMLCDIGRVLGYHSQAEYDYYDVVWRKGTDSPRLSHVFEVQRRGSIDGALAKLKRAYDAQRSKPFLIVFSERDTKRAQRQLSAAATGPFHEIGSVTTILSFEQLRRLHRALTSVEDTLAHLFER